MRRGRYAPSATLNRVLSAWRYVSRKDKVWRLARHNHQERTNVHSYTNPLTLCSFPLGKARMGLSPGNSVGVALSRRRYRSGNICGTAANITIINNKQGDTKIQKAVVTAVGFAWVCLSVTPVRKRVFLLIVPTIPTVMHGMTTAPRRLKKSAPWAVQKVRRWRYKKQQLVDDPSQLSQGGGDFILAAFVEVVVTLISLGEGSAGGFPWLARNVCHVVSYQLLRAHVPYVTSLRVKCYEPARVALGVVEMPLRDAHRPSTASTSAAIDIHTVRYRHRYWPMRIARDGRDDKEENSFSDGR